MSKAKVIVERSYRDGEKVVEVEVRDDGTVQFAIGGQEFGIGYAALEQLAEIAREGDVT